MSRITIVEDDCFMREELADILEKEGYKVTQICDFQNVYEEIQKSRPALVLLDINLPPKSGFEICKQLKEKNLCPVIILTSRTQIEDEIHGLKLGADDFLTKPYHKGRLLARIENTLQRFSGFEGILKGRGFYLDKHTYTSLYKKINQSVAGERRKKFWRCFWNIPEKLFPKRIYF